MDFNVSAPPVNNALLPDIYNRLDAELIERTRVVNTLLDKRFSMQEKVLNKYRRSAEVVHNKEVVKLRQELSRIRHSLPTVGYVHNLNAGLLTNRKRQGRCRGIYSEKDENPFCERHFIHFLPNKRKYYKVKPPEEPETSTKSPQTLPAIVPSSVDVQDGRTNDNLNSDNDIPVNNRPTKFIREPFNEREYIAIGECKDTVLPEIIGTVKNKHLSRSHLKSDARLRYHSSPPKL